MGVLVSSAVVQARVCFGALFVLQALAFVLGMLLWVVQDKPSLKAWLRWHRPGVWGGHEDFHVCALAGDAILYALLRRRGRL